MSLSAEPELAIKAIGKAWCLVRGEIEDNDGVAMLPLRSWTIARTSLDFVALTLTDRGMVDFVSEALDRAKGTRTPEDFCGLLDRLDWLSLQFRKHHPEEFRRFVCQGRSRRTRSLDLQHIQPAKAPMNNEPFTIPESALAYETLEQIQERHKRSLEEWVNWRLRNKPGSSSTGGPVSEDALRKMAGRLGIAADHHELVFSLAANQRGLEEAKRQVERDTEAAAVARQEVQEASREYEKLRPEFEAAAKRLDQARNANEEARVNLQEAKRDVSTRYPNAIAVAQRKIDTALGKG